MAKSRLSRGLSAILDDVEEAYKKDIQSDSSIVKKISLDKIVPNIYQPRKHFDEKALESLSESIKKHGVLQPIVVVKKDEGYMIIAGERRFRASKMAGLDKIDAIVADLESKNLRELALIENIQRENLSPIELAESYKELIKEYKITQEELSEIICKSRSHIANTMRLLNLSPYTQELIAKGKLTQGHAKILVGLDEASERVIADTVVGQKLSVRECEELIKRLKSKNEGEKKKDIKPAKDDLVVKKVDDAVKMIRKLGFKAKNSRNKLVIDFENKDSIDKFLKILNKLL
jgi:ParB family chromosome partitioning protein